MYSIYLSNIPLERSSYPGIDVVGHRDSWYASNYRTAQSASAAKSEIVALTNKIKKRETKPGDWDWHHVVEGQHIAMLSIHGDLDNQYNLHLPVILIHKPEHRFFSSNFTSSAFFELANVSKANKINLASDAFKLSSSDEGIVQLQERVVNLKAMYNDIYESYPTLKAIANNVFSFYQRRLIKKTIS